MSANSSSSSGYNPVKVAIALVVLAVVVIGVLVVTTRKPVDYQVLYSQAIPQMLTTKGLTCEISQASGGVSTTQTVDLDLARRQAHAVLTVKQPASTITTEEILLGGADYVRYTSASSTQKNKQGKTPDFSKVLNVWSKTDVVPSTPTLFSRTVLGNCIVPIAHFDDGTVQKLLKPASIEQMFKTNIGASRSEKVDGVLARTYDVKIQPGPYIALMKEVAKTYKFSDLDSVNAAVYQGKVGQELKFSIDPESGKLVQIRFVSGQHTINFSNDGKQPKLKPPSKAISAQELAKRFDTL